MMVLGEIMVIETLKQTKYDKGAGRRRNVRNHMDDVFALPSHRKRNLNPAISTLIFFMIASPPFSNPASMWAGPPALRHREGTTDSLEARSGSQASRDLVEASGIWHSPSARVNR